MGVLTWSLNRCVIVFWLRYFSMSKYTKWLRFCLSRIARRQQAAAAWEQIFRYSRIMDLVMVIVDDRISAAENILLVKHEIRMLVSRLLQIEEDLAADWSPVFAAICDEDTLVM